MIEKSTVKEAKLYVKLGRSSVKCLVCERKCVIPENDKGFCKTRLNIDGKLYTLTYGDLSAIESRPIEIKPFFHFWPGSTAITISTWSCNFPCPWCQNWYISKIEPNPLEAKFIAPEKVVNMALEKGDQGTCVSFNEPLMLFEYSIDLFNHARSKGLYNTYVSNGYMTLDALKCLIDAGLDGLKIDIKGNPDTYRHLLNADIDVCWRNAKYALDNGVHVEIVCLLITDLNDDEASIRYVVEEHLRRLGENIPLHFTRYYPAYKYRKPPTRIGKLEYAYKLAKKEGVLFPYLGNVPGHPYENTYCPNCGKPIIKRYGYAIRDYKITPDGKCMYCNFKIPIRGKYFSRRNFTLFI